jgi:hypothetical protein
MSGTTSERRRATLLLFAIALGLEFARRISNAKWKARTSTSRQVHGWAYRRGL